MDLTDFKSTDPSEIAGVISDQFANIATDWWKTNSTLVAGYLSSLAEAAVQTQEALAEGRIDEHTADIALHMQELNLNQTLKFTELMSLALAQRLLDAAFSVVGWMIYNRTGVNLMPQLVKP